MSLFPDSSARRKLLFSRNKLYSLLLEPLYVALRSSLNPAVPRFLLPAETQRAESIPAGLSDSPHRLLQWVLWSHGATQPPSWLSDYLMGRVRLLWGVPSLESVSPWAPAPVFASATSSGLAVCSCLSPALCYKASVICSVKCRPQTEGQLKVRQQRHPVPPHTGSRAALGPPVWPRSLPRPATQALMQGDTRPNDSLISLQDSDDPSGPWESDWGFVRSDLFCLVPVPIPVQFPHSSSRSLLPALLRPLNRGFEKRGIKGARALRG